jgi:hypothetical protein
MDVTAARENLMRDQHDRRAVRRRGGRDLTTTPFRYSGNRPAAVVARTFFDKVTHFVLDTSKFSSIIYILYEGTGLSLPVGTKGMSLHSYGPARFPKEAEWRRRLRRAARRRRPRRSGNASSCGGDTTAVTPGFWARNPPGAPGSSHEHRRDRDNAARQ